jgi:glycosyltransferase involved in cell wall biosynthesis
MRIAHVANTDYFCAFLLRGQLHALRDDDHEVEVVCGDGPMVKALETDGFRVHVVENSRRIDPLSDVRTLTRYVRLFRREAYDLVHTHNPKVNALASLAARFAGVPRIVSTVHGLYSHEGQAPLIRGFWRAFESASARLSDIVLCQSAEDVRTARWRRIVPDHRLRSLGNGVDLTRFSPRRISMEDRAALRRRIGVGRREHVVGFVGRLVREKGVLELLEAVRSRPGWRLLLIGPDERGVKRDAISPEMLTSHPNVTWLGLQADMPPLYAAMDVVALPSHREGFPRSLVEASAMGRPSVATDIRGCREVVVAGQNGLLVPVRDPASLRSAIEALMGDATRRHRLGLAGQRRARVLFDERAVLERIGRAYREIPLMGDSRPTCVFPAAQSARR